MSRKELIINIILDILKLNIKCEEYNINATWLKNYILEIINKDKLTLKLIYNNLEEQLEG